MFFHVQASSTTPAPAALKETDCWQRMRARPATLHFAVTHKAIDAAMMGELSHHTFGHSLQHIFLTHLPSVFS